MNRSIRNHMLLSLLFAAFILSSCSSGSESVTADNTESVTDQTVAGTETSSDMAIPDLPSDADYGGHDFRILITGNTSSYWQKNDFSAEDETGEVLNDARYRRNQSVEERLNVHITAVEDYGSATGSGTGYQAFSKTVMAMDYAWDAGMIAGYDCATLAYSGYLYDLYNLPYLALSERWWDQCANQDLTVSDRLFYTTGAFSTAINDATSALMFDKTLVTQFDLANPYECVLSGKWTIDAWAEMCRDISADLDGDQKYDENDRYGVIVWDDTLMGIVNATGNKCCTVSEDGKLVLSLYDPTVIAMFDAFAEHFYDKQVSYAYQRYANDITVPKKMFINHQALFFAEMLDIVSYFRDMDADFGILPLPKYDEAQDGYHHTVSSWCSVFLCVPSVIEDAERTGAVLEALAAESYNVIRPAYYDKTLVGKLLRDDESEAMLDIIINTRVYDLGWMYQIGGYNEQVMNLWRNYKTDFTSMYEKYNKTAENQINKINEAFAELNRNG